MLTERNDFFKKIVDQSFRNGEDKQRIGELWGSKEMIRSKNETLYELFKRGLIDKDGMIVKNRWMNNIAFDVYSSSKININHY